MAIHSWYKALSTEELVREIQRTDLDGWTRKILNAELLLRYDRGER